MKHWIILAFITLLASTSSLARAEPSAADRTTARRLAVEGQIALKRGDFDTAVDRFERANELVPAPSFLVRLARAKVGQGRLVEAYEIYRKIIRDGVTPDQPRAFQRALEDAKQEVKAIDPRLAWVSVTVVGAEPDAVEVSLNGAVIPNAALGAQRPVDPGTVRAVAKASGYRTAEAEVELAEGEHGPTIELRLVELPKPPPPPMDDPEQLMIDEDPPLISTTTLGYVSLGLGGAALITGGVGGLLALQKHNELLDIKCEPQTDGTCLVFDPTGSILVNAQRLNDDKETFSTLSMVGFIAGGTLVTAGLLMLVLAPDDEPAELGGVEVHPYVGLGSIGAVGRF